MCGVLKLRSPGQEPRPQRKGGGGTMYVYKGDLENKRMASRLISCSEYEAVVCNVDPNKYVKFIRDIVAHWRFPVCFVWL